MSHAITETNVNNVSNIGLMLLKMGKLTQADTERVLQKQREEGLKFGDAAKRLGLINDEDIQYVLSQQFDYGYLPPSNSKYSNDLVAAYEPFSEQVEGYRVLRSQIMFRWLNDGFKSISIAAANSKEGCSFLVANLAVVFAQSGKKTLIIDGNMRSPRQSQIFNLNQPYGLSDVLAGRASLNEVLTEISDLPNLTVLGAGTVPPNPQELIGRANFGQLMKYAHTVYDLIIIDTPASNISSDMQIYTSITRGAILTARQNFTSVAELERLKINVQSSGASVIGAVINNF